MRDAVWSIDEVNSTSIAEDKNRIQIGIGTMEAQPEVEAALNGVNVPVEAVIFKMASPVSTLDDC